VASRELGQRIAVAVVGIPITVTALYFGGWPLGLLIGTAAALTATEFYALSMASGAQPFRIAGAVAAGALVMVATLYRDLAGFAPVALSGLVVLTLASLAAAIWLRWPGGQPLRAVTSTVAGVLYAGVTLAFAPLLRSAASADAGGAQPTILASMIWVLLPLVTTWVGDSAAYFVGRAIGKHKLAPAVSPGKTVEGGVAGLVGSAGAAALLALVLGRPDSGVPFAPLTAAWIGLVLGAVAQVGDLAESMLKREAGVKDSGKLLPGHGGFLDRMDSLLFSIPAAWGLLKLAGVIS
jgi:phosphatidate cytidylyltransferase